MQDTKLDRTQNYWYNEPNLSLAMLPKTLSLFGYAMRCITNKILHYFPHTECPYLWFHKCAQVATRANSLK